jgi:hypothetical protein
MLLMSLKLNCGKRKDNSKIASRNTRRFPACYQCNSHQRLKSTALQGTNCLYGAESLLRTSRFLNRTNISPSQRNRLFITAFTWFHSKPNYSTTRSPTSDMDST